MEQAKQLNFQEIFYALLRKIWLIVLCAAVFGAGAFIITHNFITPMYQAKVTIYVNNNASNTEDLINTITSADLSTSQKLVTTYVTILKSDTVLERVAQEVGGNLSIGSIRNMMTAAAVDKTEVFEVKISNADPALAAKIANTIAAVAPGEIANIVDGGRRLNIKVCGPQKEVLSAIRSVSGVSYAEVLGNHDLDSTSFLVESEPGVDVRKAIFNLLSSKGWAIIGIEAMGVNLEDIFISVVDAPETKVKKRSKFGKKDGDKAKEAN